MQSIQIYCQLQATAAAYRKTEPQQSKNYLLVIDLQWGI